MEILEQANGSGLSGFAEPSRDSTQADQGSAPASTLLNQGLQKTHLLPQTWLEQTWSLPHRAPWASMTVGQREEQPLAGAEKGFGRGICSRDTVCILLLTSKYVCPQGDAAGVGSGLLSLPPPKQLLQLPAHSLHPPHHLGEMAVRGEVISAPGLSPTTARLSPENPTCLASPPKHLSPSTLLFFHFIFRSAAPVSSFLFVFGSYYSWLLPLFWFPSSALIRMFILAACFYTFPRCLLVVAGQRSVFGLGRHSCVAGLGPAAGASPTETQLVQERRRPGCCSLLYCLLSFLPGHCQR